MSMDVISAIKQLEGACEKAVADIEGIVTGEWLIYAVGFSNCEVSIGIVSTKEVVIQEYLNNRKVLEEFVEGEIEVTLWNCKGEFFGDVTSDFDTSVFKEVKAAKEQPDV